MSSIANAAEVSISTVSRVMGGGRGISRQTIDKVKKAAHEMGYRPKPSSSTRTSRKSKSACLRIGLVHWGNDNYLPEHAIQTYLHQKFIIETWRAASEAGHMLCLDYLNHDQPNNRSSVLAAEAVDGLIVKGSIHPETLEQLPPHVPAVILRMPMGLPATHTSVNCNYTAGIARCVRYLHEIGHRRIGFFCMADQRIDDMDKIVSYQQTLNLLELDASSYLMTPFRNQFPDSETACASAIDSWMNLAEPPTAIISSESYCYSFAEHLKTRGLLVPRDISLIDAVTGASPHHTLRENSTRLQMPARDMCKVAVEHLIRQIHNPKAPPQTVLMDMDFIIGDTTAPPPHHLP